MKTTIEGSLAQAILDLHQPNKTWGGGAEPHPDGCTQCHSPYPCETVVLICERLGLPVPEQRFTACEGAVPADEPDSFRMCMLDRGHQADGTHCQDSDGNDAPWPFKTMDEALRELFDMLEDDS